MRRRVAERQQNLYRGRELPRMVTLLGLLAVLGMIIYRARDPSTWSWLAHDDSHKAASSSTASPEGASAAPKASLATGSAEAAKADPFAKPVQAVATGPTDVESGEYAASLMERQVITDRTLHIGELEMPLYHRVATWVKSQPMACLKLRKPRRDVAFDRLMTSPEKHRLELLEVDLNVRRVIKCEDKLPGNIQLYELWGITDQSGAWLYDAMVQDLPADFPTTGDVAERVHLVGYFFKLQGYQPGGARPNARPLAAPLLIGRITWITPPKVVNKPMDIKWGIAAVALVVAVGVFWAFRGRHRSTVPRVALIPTDPDAVPIDQWLDQAESGDVDNGNNSTDNDDFPNGHTRISGNSAGGNGVHPTGGFDPSQN